jgi:hypothetical protein
VVWVGAADFAGDGALAHPEVGFLKETQLLAPTRKIDALHSQCHDKLLQYDRPSFACPDSRGGRDRDAGGIRHDSEIPRSRKEFLRISASVILVRRVLK